jgi:MinD superfamily P-loop ATPase
MPKKIAIASGKGGTGKTTVSVNLFRWINNNWTDKIQLIDADVEEPNASVFLEDHNINRSQPITRQVPVIDTEKCTFCRKCVQWCEYNAIVVIPNVKFAEINSSLCHSCGACLVACNDGAITEYPHRIGAANYYYKDKNPSLLEGDLAIGSTMQTAVIREVKKLGNKDADVHIIDSPPGTSCPVVESVLEADYVILVTEPTPFGLHDLKLTVELLEEIDKDFGVVINKAGLGNDDVYHYLEKEGIEILGELPFDKDYASEYANGNLISTNSKFLEAYDSIGNSLKNMLAS